MRNAGEKYESLKRISYLWRAAITLCRRPSTPPTAQATVKGAIRNITACKLADASGMVESLGAWACDNASPPPSSLRFFVSARYVPGLLSQRVVACI